MSRTYVAKNTQILDLSRANTSDSPFQFQCDHLYLHIYEESCPYEPPLRHLALSATQSRDFLRQCAAIMGATVTFPDESTNDADIRGDDYTKGA